MLGFRVVAKVLNILLWLLIAAGLLAPWLPARHWAWLALIPAALPVIFGLSALFAVAFRKKRNPWLYGNLIALVLLLFPLSKDVAFHRQPAPTSADVRVLSLNVQRMNNDTAHAKGILDLVQSREADVVCFQEFGLYHQWPDAAALTRYFRHALQLPHAHFGHHRHNIFGVALFSRYPIARVDTIYLPISENNAALLYTLEHPDTPLHVLVFHLASFNLGGSAPRTLTERLAIPAKTFAAQEQQLQLLVDRIRAVHGPLLVVGDLNNVPHSYAYRQLDAWLTDSFREAGTGWGYTYADPALPLRIDYQWYSGPIRATAHKVVSHPYSDHRLLEVDFALSTTGS
ncbi:MAG: endonuclease/exonuclease/phosphatase family protein [Bacteroidota bacterium]